MRKNVLQKIILALLVLLGIKTGVQGLISTINMPSHDVSVANWDERAAALKDAIPFERGMVGYISDIDIPGIEYDRQNLVGEFTLTQYAIAPIVLIQGSDDQEWNILSLTQPAYEIWITKNADDYEVIKFGGKFYLAHKKVTP
jgi:hypothetical protein